jgi:hypothetical protein
MLCRCLRFSRMAPAVICIVSSDYQVQEILEALLSDGFANCEISVLYPGVPRAPTDLPRAAIDTESKPGLKEPGWRGAAREVEPLDFPGLEPLFAAGSAVDVTLGESLTEILEEFGVSNTLVYERVQRGDVLISVCCDGDRSLERVREICLRRGVDAIEGRAAQSWPPRGGLH